MTRIDTPKDLTENLIYRAKLIEKARTDITLQESLRNACERDRLFFFNAFLWTYDPRTSDKTLPFITYPFQDELIAWDANIGKIGEDNGVEKSRDMGVTWCLCGNDLYDWLFSKEKIEILWGSRKEDYVDTPGDMGSIFEKFRYALRKLPKWMLPKGFNLEKHAMTMRLINPETGSAILGESTNQNFGRGDRKYRIRFDEMAFWECDQAAWEGCADVTKARTALSTPFGSSNKFASLLQGADRLRNIMTLHWILHPVKNKEAYYLNPAGVKLAITNNKSGFELWKKNRGVLAGRGIRGGVIRSAWYDAECERRDSKGVAQELDIDYTMSGSPFFDMVACRGQLKWAYTPRKNPMTRMEYGKFIKGRIVQHDQKLHFIDDHINGWCEIFEFPMDYLTYSQGADTSEGLPKGDESFSCIVDNYTGNLVAACHGLFAPEDFAKKLYLMSKFYYDCITAPENNNMGYTVCLEFFNLGGRLYFTKGKSGEQLKRGFTTKGSGEANRLLILNNLNDIIVNKSAEIRHPVILEQFETFIRPERRSHHPEAEGKFHDDGVMSLAIAHQIRKENPYKPRTAEKQNYARKEEYRQRTAKDNAGFGF